MFNREMPAMEAYPADLSLSSDSLYSYELGFVPSAPSEEDEQVIDRARQGDPIAREQFLTSCLRYVAKVAHTYYALLENKDHLEYLDLVAVGNLALVEHVDEVLSRNTRPAPYLRVIAKRAIWYHCRCHSLLIDLPDRPVGELPFVASLDAPISTCNDETYTFTNIVDAHLALSQEISDGEEQQASRLLLAELNDAIETVLAPREREVIRLYYGLDDVDGQGVRPEMRSLRDVSRLLSKSGTSNIASSTHRKAIVKLRRHLEQFVS